MSNIIPSHLPPVTDANAPAGAPAISPPQRLEQLCAELTAERDQLRAELAATRTERDQYLKSLYCFVGKDYVCPYTDEELLGCVDREPPLQDFIARLTRDMESAA